MPYYLVKSIEEAERYTKLIEDNVWADRPDGPTFLTRQEAHEARGLLVVVFLETRDEQRIWQAREYQRFETGMYARVPFTPYYVPRFVHRSIKQPGMVAFTRDVESGYLDKQTIMKPGRYIEQYHKGEFTPEQIAEWCADLAADKGDLQIARTIEDVRTVYNAEDLGFTSCMQRKSDPQYDWQRAMDRGDIDHPAVVYGDSDLGVAYRGPIDRVLQRAIVWPDKKQYIAEKIYGDGSLCASLQRAGYESVSRFEGARIRRVSVYRGRGYLMPYLDACGNVAEDPDDSRYWILARNGDIDARPLSGIVCDGSEESDDDETDEDGFENCRTCEHCGDDYHYVHNDNSTDTFCNSCENDRSWCEHCESDVFGCRTETINGREWCESCLDNDAMRCEDCEEWFDTTAFNRVARQERRMHNLTDRCSNCADTYTWCDVCEENWVTDDHDACPICERAPRCEKTGDLLTIVSNDGHVGSAVGSYINLNDGIPHPVDSTTNESPF